MLPRDFSRDVAENLPGNNAELQAIRSERGQARAGHKRKPEDSGTHGVEIRQVAGFGDGIGVHVIVQEDEQQPVGRMVPVKLGVAGTNPALREQRLGRTILIADETKVVIDQWGTQISTIAGAVRLNTRPQKRGGQEKQNDQDFFTDRVSRPNMQHAGGYY